MVLVSHMVDHTSSVRANLGRRRNPPATVETLMLAARRSTRAQLTTSLVAALLLISIPVALAGQQPTARPQQPDSAAFAQMAGMFNQMGPMYETMTQAMVEGTLKALERPEVVDRLAAFTRRYYEALIRQGFTKDEALQIVAGVGIPALKNTR